MRLTIATLLLMFIGAGSCAKHPTGGGAAPREAASGKDSRDSVRRIELPRFQTELPQAAGHETFSVACMSCHSARYVAMQPAFNKAKWDEIVRKMIKTYSAPIAEDQVPMIVQYLMTTKESGMPNKWNTLAGATIDAPLPEKDVTISISSTARIRDEARGAALYAQSCASCHGVSGAGDGPSANSLLPRPTDLRTRRYSLHALTAALWNGISGTAMPSYRSLPPDDLRAIVTYLSRHSVKQDETAITGNELAQARALYAENCASCHGNAGAGDGFAAAALPRSPTNLQDVQPSEQAALKAIASGIPGSSMPQWAPKLTPEEQAQLANYVRTFYEVNR